MTAATGDLALLGCLGNGVRILDLGCDRYIGEASNIAAEQARGRYLCLLDGDAVVQPGWLRALHDALAAEPEAGVAGPCFLNPDGSIREAGAMIDAFGYPVPLGRGLAGNAAAFQEPRDVDYISAATLLMPRELYLRAGGCDLAYEPARYEDADLCFKSSRFGAAYLSTAPRRASSWPKTPRCRARRRPGRWRSTISTGGNSSRAGAVIWRAVPPPICHGSLKPSSRAAR